ncbi:DUF6263 family protein [Limibacter armeniacum]|uniref:DUF6263 family protein n=1 Tax=Limibacter armeniacum TaxID=466084 RepID=UPI002FE58343
MRFIITIFLSLFILTASQAQKQTIELNLKKGEKYNQVVNATSTIQQNVAGQEVNMEILLGGNTAFVVKDIKKGVYDLEVNYEKLNMVMKLPQGEITASSEDTDSKNIFSMLLGELVNKPFSLKMDKKGKVLEITGEEVLFSSMMSKFPEIPQAQKQQIITQLEQAYGENALKGNIEMVTAIFPENSVKIDDTWSVSTKLEAGFSANVTTEYKLKAVTKDAIVLEGKANIDTTKGATESQMFSRVDIQGATVSTVKLSPKTGWIISAHVEQQMKGDSYINNPQTQEEMKIPIEMSSVTEISDN